MIVTELSTKTVNNEACAHCRAARIFEQKKLCSLKTCAILTVLALQGCNQERKKRR